LSLVSSVFVGLGRTAKRRLFGFGLGVAAATQWTGCPLPRHVGGWRLGQGCARLG
jgi:hypothetical protein